jgi:hypothetical protein
MTRVERTAEIVEAFSRLIKKSPLEIRVILLQMKEVEEATLREE